MSFNLKKELLRKLVHSSGLIFIILGKSSPNLSVIFLMTATFFYSLICLLEKNSRFHPQIIQSFIGFFKREKGIDWAPPALATGISALLLFLPFQWAACGILQVCLSDTAACLIGKKWGLRKIFYSSQKTYLGTFAFFIFSFTSQLFFISPSESLILSLIGTFVESLPIPTWDNFLIPLAIILTSFLF